MELQLSIKSFCKVKATVISRGSKYQNAEIFIFYDKKSMVFSIKM